MRKALVVGMEHYDSPSIDNLKGCINDAKKIAALLSFHHSSDEQGEANFGCRIMTSSDNENNRLTRARLQSEIEQLFIDEEADIALLYFSGHGYENSLGGYLVTQDAQSYEEGVSFNDIMIYANNSSVRECIIILDCCMSGHMGNIPMPLLRQATIKKGVSILTSSTANQVSYLVNNESVFTTLLCNAMAGGNTDILGNVKLTHLYEHADKMLGPWDQRPTFKTNTSKLSVIRKAESKINPSILKRIVSYFPANNYRYKLDPAFEPSEGHKDIKKEKIFGDLQKLSNVGLVKPYGEEHMYYAALNSKHCILTEMGKQYWDLISKELI